MELHRLIPTLTRLPRPVYARAESLHAGSWTSRYRHTWMQLFYAINGMLGVHTIEGSFFAPLQWAIWIPAQLKHEVAISTHAETRSLYIRGDACAQAPTRCRVLEVTPLAREPIKSFYELPVDHPEGDSVELRLVQVLLGQLRLLSEVVFSLPMLRKPRLL